MLPENTELVPKAPEDMAPELKFHQEIAPLATLPDTTALSAISVAIIAPLAICSAVMLPEAIAY